MTVALSTRRNGPYTASAGQTAFDFTWQANVAGDLVVTRRRNSVDTVLTYPANYTLAPGSLANPAGGQILLVTGATAGDQIVITGHTDAERATAFADERQIRADALNSEFDKMQRQLQEHRRDLDRAVVFDAFAGGAPPTLPSPQDGRALVWNGGNLANSDIGAGAVAAAEAAANIATNKAAEALASQTASAASALTASNAAAAAVAAQAAIPHIVVVVDDEGDIPGSPAANTIYVVTL